MSDVLEMANQYVAYKRALGLKTNGVSSCLLAFCNFVGREKSASEITEDLCISFLKGKSGCSSGTWRSKHSVLRKFFEWLQARGLVQQIPLPTYKPKAASPFVPHIYSDAELRSMFDAALNYQTVRSANYPQCVRMAIMLCYLLGLRISEALKLTVEDIDFKGRALRIMDSKFSKSRVVTFNQQVGALLEDFMKWRKATFGLLAKKSPLLPQRNLAPMRAANVEIAFRKIRRLAGVAATNGNGRQPRIHDLRHSFAVHRLLAWYRSGKDVQRLLPLLSTYLGHKGLQETSVYLTMIPELLSEASVRFEAFARRKEH